MVVFPGAKINLGLYVTSKRDDGYHNIETLFYPIGFSDILEVVSNSTGNQGDISISISGITVEGSTESNLVVKAYRLLHDRLGLPAVHIFLHKCIPTGAGLGGGSSDGASMLVVLNKLFDLNLSYCEMASLALKLGSDCPYFIDSVPSFARGRGEIITSSDVSLRGMYLFLFHPAKGISTAGAYQNVRVGETGENLEKIVQLPVAAWKATLNNVFEPFAINQVPLIGEIKEELYRCGASYASMTGSGSAVYGLFNQDIEIPGSLKNYLIWQERF